MSGKNTKAALKASSIEPGSRVLPSAYNNEIIFNENRKCPSIGHKLCQQTGHYLWHSQPCVRRLSMKKILIKVEC